LPVEVINISVGGWSTEDEISYLEHVGVGFAPDLVLVAFVLNDADGAGGLDVWDSFRLQYEKSALRFSCLLSYVYAKIGQRCFVRRYVEETLNDSMNQRDIWNGCFRELNRGREIASSVGSAYAVAIIPFMYDLSSSHPFLPLHQMIAGNCEQDGIPVLDLLPAFMGQQYERLWVHASDPHPNEKGHALIAEGLLRFIEDDHLLQDIRPARAGAVPDRSGHPE
jgi:lysophospholipase L1-like esterase